MRHFDCDIAGKLVRGHQIASGTNPNSPYPSGSIALQIPFFKQLGLDLTGYHAATLNISVEPQALVWVQPVFQFEHLVWVAGLAPETFWFAPCEVVYQDMCYQGWIYYPHPETKTQHFHDASVVEVICQQYIPSVCYGDIIGLRCSIEHLNFKPKFSR